MKNLYFFMIFTILTSCAQDPGADSDSNVKSTITDKARNSDSKLKMVPLYNMSKNRDDKNRFVNHLLATSEEKIRLEGLGYKAYGPKGKPNVPIGCVVSPDAFVEGWGLIPIFRGAASNAADNHIHYFKKRQAKFEKLVGFAFNQNDSFNSHFHSYTGICRFDFPADESRGISDDMLTLCSEKDRLARGTISNGTNVSWIQRELNQVESIPSKEHIGIGTNAKLYIGGYANGKCQN